jgi:hypothetical protein
MEAGSKEDINDRIRELHDKFKRSSMFSEVRLQPSNIQHSPYEYLYLYLTNAHEEGPYLVISEQAEVEWGNDLLIGAYESVEWSDVHIVPEESVEAGVIGDALALLRRLVDKQNAELGAPEVESRYVVTAKIKVRAVSQEQAEELVSERLEEAGEFVGYSLFRQHEKVREAEYHNAE